MDVKQHHIVVLICISSGVSDTEHLFMCLLVIYKCFLQETIYLNLWPIFYLDCLFSLLTCRNSLPRVLILDLIYDIFPIPLAAFHSVPSDLQCTKVLILINSTVSTFFFCCLCFGFISKKSLQNPMSCSSFLC